jgi:hypothetical protein
LVRAVRTSSICFSVKGSTLVRAVQMTPIGTPSRNSGTPSIERSLPIRASPFGA